MSDSDQIQRVMFDELDIRGVVTGLDQAYNDALENHNYPMVIRKILGEMMAASVILAANLKFDGRLILQAQAAGNVRLLMSESNNKQQVRSIARFDDVELPENATFTELMKDGQLVITIEPEHGQRYQGVVPLEGEHLNQCLEAYFRYSEQLDSQLHLACDGEKAAGLLLQILPVSEKKDEDWARISQLGATLKSQELLELDSETMLYRLFHEETCRLHEGDEITFNCSCSRERTGQSLLMMTQEELRDMVAEQGVVEVACQFCNTHYKFDDADILVLFSDTAQAPGSDSVH